MTSQSRLAYLSHLFELNESDISHTTSFVVPVHSQTNIREEHVPLEYNVSKQKINHNIVI